MTDCSDYTPWRPPRDLDEGANLICGRVYRGPFALIVAIACDVGAATAGTGRESRRRDLRSDERRDIGALERRGSRLPSYSGRLSPPSCLFRVVEYGY